MGALGLGGGRKRGGGGGGGGVYTSLSEKSAWGSNWSSIDLRFV